MWNSTHIEWFNNKNTKNPLPSKKIHSIRRILCLKKINNISPIPIRIYIYICRHLGIYSFFPTFSKSPVTRREGFPSVGLFSKSLWGLHGFPHPVPADRGRRFLGCHFPSLSGSTSMDVTHFVCHFDDNLLRCHEFAPWATFWYLFFGPTSIFWGNLFFIWDAGMCEEVGAVLMTWKSGWRC